MKQLISRRRFMSVLGAAAAVGAFSSVAPVGASACLPFFDHLRRTPCGYIRGVAAKAPGVTAYKGIRYAEAGRWEYPRQVTRWNGIYDASEFGPCAMQDNAITPEWKNGRDQFYYHEFREGPLVDAVTASCSIPIIFSPVTINGVHYVDGGLFHNFPVSIIREECERIIGVNVSPMVPQKYKQPLFHIAERSYHYMFRANTLEDREMCDVLIEAEEFGKYKTFDLENVDQIARIGYAAAVRAFEKLIQENKDAQWVRTLKEARDRALNP